MTRIISGSARGRSIDVPKEGTRPTSERVREALFSSLGHRMGNWANVHVLDMFAGTAALSFEALSRGASSATAIEKDRHACDVIRKNSMHLKLPLSVLCEDVSRFLIRPSSKTFGVVFIDPPYVMPSEEVSSLIALLKSNNYLAVGSVVVVERSRRSADVVFPDELSIEDDRLYGETRIITAVW
jgi:16S rRNA (guanine966-N2)-methyltransferase